MSSSLKSQQIDDSENTPPGHGGARPKVSGQHVNGCQIDKSGGKNADMFEDGKADSRGCENHTCENKESEFNTRTNLFTVSREVDEIQENGVDRDSSRKSDGEDEPLDVGRMSRGRTLSGQWGNDCRRNNSSRHEHHLSYPLLQWAFSGSISDPVMQGSGQSSIFGPDSNHKNKFHCDDYSTSHRTRCKDNKGNLCKSQSLLLTQNPNVLIKMPSNSQVNHISLYDEADELLALERWRNAGLALRRVLNNKALAKHKGGKSETRDQEGETVQISPECQYVLDEIFDDVDEDTLRTIGSSSTCSTSESPDVVTHLDQISDISRPLPIQQPESSRQSCDSATVSTGLDRGCGIWDSQLYPTDMSGQFRLTATDHEDTDTSGEGRASGEGGLFPWRHGATLLGACLFPQCLGIIGGQRHIGGIWDKSREMCNDRNFNECNNDSSKLNCDTNYRGGNCAIQLADGQTETRKYESRPCGVVSDKSAGGEGYNKVKHNRLSWNTDDERFVFDSEDGVILPTDASSVIRLSGSQCTSSFHSEDSHGDATKSSGYHGDKGGDSDVNGDYSSLCDGSGDIYFYEDNDKFDTVPRRQKPKDKSASPFKKPLQREKKKKLVHARKTHKRKSSSSSSDVLPDENNIEAQDMPDVTQPFQSVYEPCPSFITCDAVDNYDPGQITPPRRSVSIARHFLDRGRSRERSTPGSSGLFRTRDVTVSDLSPLPSFDLSPLSRLPSFLESLQNSFSPTPDVDHQKDTMNSIGTQETEAGSSNKGGNSSNLQEKITNTHKSENADSNVTPNCTGMISSGSAVPFENKAGDKGLVDKDADADESRADNSGLTLSRGSNSLLSPDSWIKLIDEIYQPIVCQSDVGEESALSDTETEKAENKTPDFFRCLDTTDKSSDSGDADDEFECECDHCQLLRSLDRPSRFLPAVPSTGDTVDGEAGETTLRGDPWETDWAGTSDDTFDINLDDLRPLEPFLLSLQDLPQDPVDLMFQNVITQMLAVHPELLGEQAPPPVPQSVIDSLPALTATNENIDDDLTCPVCLCHFEVGEAMTRLPCHHRYHPLCIQAWLAKSGTCPVCRHSLHSRGHGREGDHNDI